MRLHHLLSAIGTALLLAAMPATHAEEHEAVTASRSGTPPALPLAALAEENPATLGKAKEGQPDATTFEAAAQYYEAGDYPAAVAAFRAIAEQAPSAAVFYNLGNAYYRTRDYGRAIAAYEKAQAMEYGNPAIAANLARARQAAGISLQSQTRWQQYARYLSPNAWVTLGAISFWGVLALWLLPPLFRKRSGIWRPSLLALCAAILLLSLAGFYPWLRLSRGGTVLEADTPLLLAPTQTSPVHSYAQAGESATLLRRHGGFAQIRLANGSKGWVADALFSTSWQR